MPSEDIPGTDKHIRFGKISPEIYEALIGIPGVKAVVLHKIGRKSENPHWHIWCECPEAITNQTWKNHAHKIPALKGFKGNGDWSFRNHNSWDVWKKYVTDNLSHEILLDYRDLREVSEKAKLLTLEIPSPVTPIIPGPTTLKAKSPSKLRWDEKICLDAQTRLNWKRDAEFSLASLEDPRQKVMKQVEKQVFAFMHGRVNNQEAVKYCRNLLYEFGDDDVKEYLERKVFEKISWA